MSIRTLKYKAQLIEEECRLSTNPTKFAPLFVRINQFIVTVDQVLKVNFMGVNINGVYTDLYYDEFIKHNYDLINKWYDVIVEQYELFKVI